MTNERQVHGRKAWPWLIYGVLFTLIGMVAAWSLAQTVQPPFDVATEAPFALVSVQAGNVGDSIAVTASAGWSPERAGVNRASGVVTSVMVQPGAEVAPGDTIYTVDLRPVVIAEGRVPSFRDVALGARGEDVEQLQSLLTELGYYNLAIDGKAETGTVSAVKRLQRQLGVEETGTVQQGDVVYVPHLPARVVLDSNIVFPGATVAGGEPAVSMLPTAPSFSAAVTDAQASQVAAGMKVNLQSPSNQTWSGVIESITRDVSNQSTTLKIAGADGNSPCGDECSQLSAGEETSLPATVITAPPVSGLTVPSAALVTSDGSHVSVISETGESLPVSVIASARGISVVEGVAAGTWIRTPATREG